MIIVREAYKLIKQKLQKNKVLLLYGPRRVGKTTLLNELAKDIEGAGEKCKFVSGENLIVQKEISSQSIAGLKGFVGKADVLIVDEAQKVPDIGLNLKLIVDHVPGVKVIASGSASFALAKEVGEPLTGRKKTIHLYTISAKELIEAYDLTYFQEILESNLILGTYPELFTLSSKDDRKEYLRELVDSYLFRDIFELEQIRNPKKIRDLLTLLSFQIGKEVSLSELANSLDLHTDTVYRYLDLMEKSFIIINVRGFSRNLRKEVTKTSRYYFYDNGIRNALINNFNPIDIRNDVGELWENYIIMERIKRQAYQQISSNNYFWRTYDQKEIDWVEEREGILYGYEVKWRAAKGKPPKVWLAAYENARYQVINKDNYLEFIT